MLRDTFDGASARDAASPGITTRLVPIAQGYASSGINAITFQIESLVTFGNYEFVGYYSAGTTPNVTIARRSLGSTNWSIVNTGFTANDVTDDHDVINMGMDGSGYLHLSWGMHGGAFRYARSKSPVTNSTLPGFTAYTYLTATTNENAVTYPEFFQLRNGDLLYLYRTGGSRDGDTHLNRWNNSKRTWSVIHHPLVLGEVAINGISSSVNAYPDRMILDANDVLHWMWVWRDNGLNGFDNRGYFYARSADFGTNWADATGGAITLPITQTNSRPVVPVQTQVHGTELMNQSGMCVDNENRPMAANWWAPNFDDICQFMLVWSDGQQWHTSQMSNRTNLFDGNFREMARPIVLTDQYDRVLIVFRDVARGNVVSLAWSADAQRRHWDFADLDSTPMGAWEPTFNFSLWKRDRVLHLFHQPLVTGPAATQVSVLEWDPATYFANSQAVTALDLVNAETGTTIRTLHDGDRITLDAGAMTVVARTVGGVGSIRWSLNGAKTFRMDNGSQFALAGRWQPSASGDYVITAQPFSSANGTGLPGRGLSLKVTVSNAADALTDWTHRAELRLTNCTAGTLTNFPVLIKLNAGLAGFDYSQAEPRGLDLRFTDPQGHLLPHQIERWYANGDSSVWVLVPSFTSFSRLIMYWGNPAASELPAAWAQGVWEADCRAVWHMDGYVADSTTNHNDASIFPNGICQANEQVGLGMQYTAPALAIQVRSSPSLSTMSNLTLSAWVNASTLDGIAPTVLAKDGSQGYLLRIENGNTLRLYVHGEDGVHTVTMVGAPFATSTWYYLAVTVEQDMHTVAFYRDGSLVGSVPLTASFTGVSAGSGPMLIGNTALSNSAAGWQGMLDEVRVEAVARSANWIAACWLNQLQPQTTFGLALDSDRDGMPDDWEIAHGLNPYDPADASLDSDGDGQSNLAEYYAETSPKDAADRFGIRAEVNCGQVMILTDGKAGRRYTLERATALNSGQWVPVQTADILATNAPLVLVDVIPSTGQAFYRVRVELP